MNRARHSRGVFGSSPTPGGRFRETSRTTSLPIFESSVYQLGVTSSIKSFICGFWHAPASTLQPRATARIGSTTETTYARNAIAIGSRRAERLQNRLAAHCTRRGVQPSATRRRCLWPTRQAVASREQKRWIDPESQKHRSTNTTHQRPRPSQHQP